jgi:hypothetical protein
MKELSILSASVGIIVGILIATAVDYKYDLSQTDQSRTSFKHPYIYWQDTINRPSHGFEQAMDMYENETRDTIYMQRSYGPTK